MLLTETDAPCPQGPVSSEAAVAGPRSGKSLADPLWNLSVLSLMRYSVHWTGKAPGKGAQCVGAIKSGRNAFSNPMLKSQLSIISDTSKTQVYFTLDSLRNKSCITVRGRQCEPRLKPPCRKKEGWIQGHSGHQGVHSVH